MLLGVNSGTSSHGSKGADFRNIPVLLAPAGLFCIPPCSVYMPFNRGSVTIQDLYTLILNFGLNSEANVIPQITTHHPGLVDPDEAFNGLKSSDILSISTAQENRYQAQAALPNSRNAQRKTWEREEEHRDSRAQITRLFLWL